VVLCPEIFAAVQPIELCCLLPEEEFEVKSLYFCVSTVFYSFLHVPQLEIRL
jgi:hypothetical protein